MIVSLFFPLSFWLMPRCIVGVTITAMATLVCASKKDKLIVWRNSIELIQQLCHRRRRRRRRCSVNIKITRQRTIHAI